MTFKIELINHGAVSILKSAFESIEKIVDEITLVADSDGLHLNTLDKSHITFITLDLDKTFFDEYQCDVPEKIAIDCTKFFKILKKAKNTDILELNIGDNSLIITLKGDATRKFQLKFIDLTYENSVPPTLELPYSIKIPSNLLKEYVNDMDMYSEVLTFTLDEDYFIISTEGQNGNAEIKYLHGENVNDVVRSNFSIEKLQDILKANKFTEECILIGDDMPLQLVMNLVTGDGKLEYLLAPRLNESED